VVSPPPSTPGAPAGGTVTSTGTVGWLPQNLTLRPFMTVAELLGIDRQLTALRAIESGSVAVEDFEAVGADWDIDSRARAALDSAGLVSLSLDRPVGTLSGGETVLTALTGLRLAGDSVVLLDEPTNNLDRGARQRLYDTITAWTGALIVVSHDVTFLELMDETAELYNGSLSVVGGPYSAYRAQHEAEQEAAAQALRTAEQQLRREQRQRIEAQTRLARRQRYARTDFENKRKPKIIMNQRKAEAQVSAGKLRGELDAKVSAAQESADEQSERIRSDNRIVIDLPDPHLHSGRRLAELRSATGTSVLVQGRQWIALTGANGVGKTQLVTSLLHPLSSDSPTTPQVEAIAHTSRIGLLPQRLDHLAHDRSILDTVAAAVPGTPPGQLRNRLARFQFRAETVHRLLGDLSGGERFRVALAALLADPPHQLLVLDEPKKLKGDTSCLRFQSTAYGLAA